MGASQRENARAAAAAVLIDVELPDGDGVTLARELAALPWHPRIVLTSIDGDITTTEEARNAGASAFVNKADLPNAPCGRCSAPNSQTPRSRGTVHRCQGRYGW